MVVMYYAAERILYVSNVFIHQTVGTFLYFSKNLPLNDIFSAKKGPELFFLLFYGSDTGYLIMDQRSKKGRQNSDILNIFQHLIRLITSVNVASTLNLVGF